MKTYTKHKLTDAQCRRLSTIINKGKGAQGGVATDALVRKGLVRELMETHTYAPLHEGQLPYTREIFVGREATVEGKLALELARREGW